jgi:hypothetical protein
MKFFRNLPPDVKILLTAIEMGFGLFLATAMLVNQQVEYNIFRETQQLAPAFVVVWFVVRFVIELTVGEDGTRPKH